MQTKAYKFIMSLNYYRKLLLLVTFVFVSGCSKNQDDIDLPIYDAIGDDFTLPSTLDAPLTLSDYKGKIVLLNFGYTNCPDVCPMVLTRLANISNRLESEFGISTNRLQTIFISVDPERDDIIRLKEYLGFFNPNFIGISASLEATHQVTKSYSVFFEKVQDENAGYQVAHNDKIFLLDKRGRLRALIGKTDPDQKLINDIASLAAAEL